MSTLRQSSRSLLEIERLLLNVLAEAPRWIGEPPQDNGPEWLYHALEAIREPEQLAGGLSNFFRLAGRCPDYVARTLKQYVNITPTDAVNQARLEYATTQLESTDNPIIDIAMDSGFENLSYFHRLFRRQFGITPLQYRLSRHNPD